MTHSSELLGLVSGLVAVLKIKPVKFVKQCLFIVVPATGKFYQMHQTLLTLFKRGFKLSYSHMHLIGFISFFSKGYVYTHV